MGQEGFSAWIGRSEEAVELVAPAPLRRLAALLDYAAPPWRDGEAPPLGHWLYFLPDAPQSQLDLDGHPKRGGFLPPVALPRRMWAGGRLSFHTPIVVGRELRKRSTIADIKAKAGASGEMVFVTVRHELSQDAVCVVEEQDIVYRAAAGPPSTASRSPSPKGEEFLTATAAPASTFTRPFTADPTQLFRFSALTFNAHRIHYDRDYARDLEGYPGLVVQGPFVAMLLLDHFLRRRPQAQVAAFSFRAKKPLFDAMQAELCLAEQDIGAELWCRDAAGETTMTARVEAK